jgi:hypothetical protein
MPDTKITALTAIGANPIIPATFPIPMVDLTDTSMAASGTTKKVTVNQILGAGGTATLASATITGDLTVDTNVLKVDTLNNRVGIGTASPATIFDIQSAGTLYSRLQNTASTADAAFIAKNTTGEGLFGINAAGPYVYTATALSIVFSTNGSERYRIASDGVATWSNVGGVAGTAMTLNATGLGVGVTPSAWGGSNRSAIQFPGGNAIQGSGSLGLASFSNAYNNGTNDIYIANGVAYKHVIGTGFQWFNAPSGTAGNAITFTQAMTLDASGNLLVGTTTNTNSSRVFARGTASSSALALQGATGDVALAQLTVGKFDNNTTTSQVFVRFTINDNSGGSGQINANGASQAAFGSFSDSRLKENIVSIPSQLANILSLRPVEFDYKDGSGHQIGFVAQEIQEVYSDAVGEQNGFLTVTGWSKTEARLVSAIKELAAKVQALEAKLA